MLFLGVGIVLLALKWLEVDPVAAWSWWLVLAPFALAALWWTVADSIGYTSRKAAERDEARKQARIERQREALGKRRPRR
ncbi:TIGR04438 family Trp-rich protein [Xylophilus sp. GOD-11R]|uniref:TIGR04438 family Trp-rich protein n=1 Tax=Xylophilus sp. GOD-11R TaxID=3089814 RepID=UPI00298D274A|nr:TIGR04438 family Trp-rich protein [Xylophilus sp. GOD-11R]WPB58546.1 TIGR04438 family Trp-rich protein [Xylophilus sp. GOD-11R]